MTLKISRATPRDIPDLAMLRRDTARALTARFGEGHWSEEGTEETVQIGMARSIYLVGREQGKVVGTLRLSPSRPSAIDPGYFTPVRRPIYLTDMAVTPSRQRTGLGRILLDAARRSSQSLKAGAIRLDAYDAPAGAGEFYLRCGFQMRGATVYHSVPLLYFECLLATPVPGNDANRPDWRLF